MRLLKSALVLSLALFLQASVVAFHSACINGTTFLGTFEQARITIDESSKKEVSAKTNVSSIDKRQILLTIPFDSYANDEMYSKREKQVSKGKLYEFFEFSNNESDYPKLINAVSDIVLKQAELSDSHGLVPLDIVVTPEEGRIFIRGTLETYGFVIGRNEVFRCK